MELQDDSDDHCKEKQQGVKQYLLQCVRGKVVTENFQHDDPL
jgi:hypothetical protein